MSTTLSLALEVAKNTLLNTQVQMGTAAHNIANADNKSYAKQKVLLTTNLALNLGAGFVGMGAKIQTVVQQRDQFVEKSLIGTISKEADYKARSERLATAAAQMRDDGETGISGALGAFWDSWESLSQNPLGLSEKTLVTQATTDLTLLIRETSAGLASTAADVETEAEREVSKVNDLISQIAEYNEEIFGNEVNGDTANDLRDLRYKALTELAESLPISYTEESDGTLTITVSDYSNDITLVSSNQAGSLTYDTTNHRVTYSDYQGTVHPTPPGPVPPEENNLSGGRINGLLTVYKSIGTSHDLAYVLANPDASDLTYVDRLNAFASTLITQVNTAHGSNVFSGTDADDIDVDPSFTIDANQALSITDLQDTRFADLGDAEFSEYLSDIQQRLGLDQERAESLVTFQETLRQQLEVQQQTVSGVSIDEEMVEMLKYQQIYQAAAKVIQTTSEMLGAVINNI